MTVALAIGFFVGFMGGWIGCLLLRYLPETRKVEQLRLKWIEGLIFRNGGAGHR